MASQTIILLFRAENKMQIVYIPSDNLFRQQSETPVLINDDE